jgi:hypothetical protein
LKKSELKFLVLAKVCEWKKMLNDTPFIFNFFFISHLPMNISANFPVFWFQEMNCDSQSPKCPTKLHNCSCRLSCGESRSHALGSGSPKFKPYQSHFLFPEIYTKEGSIILHRIMWSVISGVKHSLVRLIYGFKTPNVLRQVL